MVLLVIPRGVARELEDLRREVLQDHRQVHCTRAPQSN
jgi:hypothetical protein